MHKSPCLRHEDKSGHDELDRNNGERIDAMEFVARVLVQIPDARRHSDRYYGAYSDAARGKRDDRTRDDGGRFRARMREARSVSSTYG